MLPTQNYGICSFCHDPNPYTQTNCVRCGERLAWAFLIDGRKDSDFAPPLAKFFGRLFGKRDASPKRVVVCRFCSGPVVFDDKVCPHCKEWLTSAPGGSRHDAVVDKDAPEIQRLLKVRGKIR